MRHPPLEAAAPIGPASSLPAPTEPVQSGGFSFGEMPEIIPAVSPPVPTPEPATTPTPTPISATSEAPSSGFNFDSIADPTPADPAPTVAAPIAQEIVLPPAETIAPAQASEAPEVGLDLGDVFGTPAPVATTNTNEGVSFDDLDLGLDTGQRDDGLNLGGVVGQDDFGFGASEEFGGFGAGLSGGDVGGAAVYEALAHSIEDLSSEISRSLSFYLERVPDAALSRIYLTGGGALLKNLDVFLTSRLGAPTAILNPLQLLPVADQSEIPSGPLYTVALGLALRDFVD